jgi:hypothetical protein
MEVAQKQAPVLYDKPRNNNGKGAVRNTIENDEPRGKAPSKS